MIRLIGTLTWTYTYDAYGVQQNPDPLDGNAFRYAGQYFDLESGTYYLRSRYYNPNTGRFTQQDSWTNANRGDPLGLNLYPGLSGFPHYFPEIHKPCLKYLQAGLVFCFVTKSSASNGTCFWMCQLVCYPRRGSKRVFCVVNVRMQIKVFNISIVPDFGCERESIGIIWFNIGYKIGKIQN